MVEFDYEEVVKATDNFNPTRLIGKGSHGLVYKGVLPKLHHNKHMKYMVAIKKPSQGLQSLGDPNLKLHNEIRVLSTLAESPHVLRLVGTSHDSFNNKLLVMEHMPNGSLYDWLHSAKTPPTWPKRVEIAMQIARGVRFLHQGKPLVIHRDIKSTNILFDSQWNAKLADFGLAVVIGAGVESPGRPAGTIGYLDPCYTTPDKLSTKNDIFSFGVVLLEIMSGRKAIDVCKTPASIVEWAIPLMEERVSVFLMLEEICDTRIALPASYMGGTITQFLRVAARCVSPNEDDRPSAGEVIMGMENCFMLMERVRFPTWTGVLKSMVRLRKQRKLTMTVTAPHTHAHTHSQTQAAETQEGDEVDSDPHVPSGKKLSMTIKEVLADVTFG